MVQVVRGTPSPRIEPFADVGLNDQQVYLDQRVAALNDWVGPWVGR